MVLTDECLWGHLVCPLVHPDVGGGSVSYTDLPSPAPPPSGYTQASAHLLAGLTPARYLHLDETLFRAFCPFPPVTFSI